MYLHLLSAYFCRVQKYPYVDKAGVCHGMWFMATFWCQTRTQWCIASALRCSGRRASGKPYHSREPSTLPEEALTLCNFRQLGKSIIYLVSLWRKKLMINILCLFYCQIFFFVSLVKQFLLLCILMQSKGYVIQRCHKATQKVRQHLSLDWKPLEGKACGSVRPPVTQDAALGPANQHPENLFLALSTTSKGA